MVSFISISCGLSSDNSCSYSALCLPDLKYVSIDLTHGIKALFNTVDFQLLKTIKLEMLSKEFGWKHNIKAMHGIILFTNFIRIVNVK